MSLIKKILRILAVLVLLCGGCLLVILHNDAARERARSVTSSEKKIERESIHDTHTTVVDLSRHIKPLKDGESVAIELMADSQARTLSRNIASFGSGSLTGMDINHSDKSLDWRSGNIALHLFSSDDLRDYNMYYVEVDATVRKNECDFGNNYIPNIWSIGYKNRSMYYKISKMNILKEGSVYWSQATHRCGRYLERKMQRVDYINSTDVIYVDSSGVLLDENFWSFGKASVVLTIKKI